MGVAESLRDRRPRSVRKRVLTAEMVERIVHTTVHEKPEGRTHWTTRSLAKHLKISKMAVPQVWKKQKLQFPRRRASAPLLSRPGKWRVEADTISLFT